MSTTKPGRKPQAGARYPSGKLKPQRAETAPAQIRRIVDMANQGAAHALLGTPIGWLKLHGVLTNIQVAAAVEYGRLRGRYDHAIDSPARSAASPSYGAAFGLSASAEAAPADVAERARESIERFYEVEKALMAAPASGIATRPVIQDRPAMARRSSIMDLLDRVCVENRHPASWETAQLCTALDRLAVLFQVDNLIR